MTRLILAATLSGVLGTSYAAWHLRDETAWAPVPVPEPHDTQAEDFEPQHMLAIAEGACTGHGRTWVPVKGGSDCWDVPSLGVARVGWSRTASAARPPGQHKTVSEREPEELVGSKTDRAGALGVRPGRAGTDFREARR